MRAGDAAELDGAVALDGGDAAPGAPSCQTTVPSMAIVRACPNSGNTTVPDVPAGADIVSANELSPSPRRQRDTSAPAGVGHLTLRPLHVPGCGAMIQVL